MNDFEFLTGFYGLLLGLTVVEVATRFADAVDSHRDRPIGLLTPLLAVFVLFDVTSYWIWLWSIREVVTVSWWSVVVSVTGAIAYFLAAALVFPRSPERWTSLDEHYWSRKRWVLSGIIAIAIGTMMAQLSRTLPEAGDVWFYFWQATYFVPIVVLWFSRRRGLDVAMLAILLAYYPLSASALLPNSNWGDAVGLNGTVSAVAAGEGRD